jgi:hypothetical protein
MSVGKAVLVFLSFGVVLLALSVSGMVATLMGCIDLDDWGNLLLGFMNAGCVCNLIGHIMFVASVAAAVNGKDENGNSVKFGGVFDPDELSPAAGGVAGWCSIIAIIAAAILFRTSTVNGSSGGGAGARRAGGKGGAAFSPSFKFGGSAMRPTAKPGKQHGKRPSGNTGKKGGYL